MMTIILYYITETRGICGSDRSDELWLNYFFFWKTPLLITFFDLNRTISKDLWYKTIQTEGEIIAQKNSDHSSKHVHHDGAYDTSTRTRRIVSSTNTTSPIQRTSRRLRSSHCQLSPLPRSRASKTTRYIAQRPPGKSNKCPRKSASPNSIAWPVIREPDGRSDRVSGCLCSQQQRWI